MLKSYYWCCWWRCQRPLDDASDLNTSVGSGFIDDDGMGVEMTTAVGSSSLNISYVANDLVDNHGIINNSTTGNDAAMSASIAVPVGLGLYTWCC